MPVQSRRGFLVQSAAIPLLASPLLSKPLTKANLGVQLYTVRELMPKDPAGVLKQIKDIGYAELESTDYGTTDDVWKAEAASGLKLTSVHFNADLLDGEDQAVQSKMAQFKKLGFSYMVYPYVAPQKRGGLDVIKRLADKLNKTGALAQKHGLQLCYHNHAFEFEPMGGSTPLETLLSNTDKKTLSLEMDIFWVTVAGHNPVELLGKYSGRVPLLHVKDKAKGVPAMPQFNEQVPKDTFKEAGAGSIDLPSVLKAADKAGVQHYFVEQDQSPDPIASLGKSYAYLSKLFGR